MPESVKFHGAGGAAAAGAPGWRLASTASGTNPGRVEGPLGSGAVPNCSKGSNPAPGAPGAGREGTGAGVATASTADSRVTRKVWLHFVQRTLTPLSVTFSSGILNRVWHCS